MYCRSIYIAMIAMSGTDNRKHVLGSYFFVWPISIDIGGRNEPTRVNVSPERVAILGQVPFN